MVKKNYIRKRAWYLIATRHQYDEWQAFLRPPPLCCVKCKCVCAPKGNPNAPPEEWIVGCCSHTKPCGGGGQLRISNNQNNTSTDT